MDYEKKYNEALERARALWQEAIEKEYTNDYLKDYETIFPELRESEGERIRRTLVEYFGPKVQLDFVRGIPIQKIRDWLEKQKEPKKEFHIPDYMGMAHYNPVPIEQKENKDELVYRLNGLMQDYIKEGKDEDEKEHRLKCYQLFWDALEDTSYFEQKEQKPELVQQPPITYTYNSNASREERLKAALLALLNSDLLKVKEGGYFTKQDLIEWVERIPTDKPVEWSEEDIQMYNRIKEDLSYPGDFSDYPTKEESEMYDDCQEKLNWFEKKIKSLRPGRKPTE